MKSVLLVRVPDDVYQAIQKEAQALGVKDSNVVRASIDLYFSTSVTKRMKHVVIPPPPKRRKPMPKKQEEDAQP